MIAAHAARPASLVSDAENPALAIWLVACLKGSTGTTPLQHLQLMEEAPPRREAIKNPALGGAVIRVCFLSGDR